MALFQRGCGLGQYLLGKVRVVDCSGHGNRADEDTEHDDRFAFSDLAVGVVDEVGQHGEVFLHLVAVFGSGCAAGATDLLRDARHSAAGLGMIAMPRAEVAVVSLIVAEETTATGIVARMVERYSNWENLRTLWHSARSAVARKDS
jgi:hypothetical protein